ncbi:MAG: Fic family protein, partial [Flavobacterium sp.]
MKKLESAPIWHQKELYDDAMKHRFDSEVEELVYNINEKYPYWDKLKYYDTGKLKSPVLLWVVVKVSRILSAKKVSFGNQKFSYNLTDTIQKGLHEFDLHIGGNLGSKNIIPEDEKKRYLISSIMEEAIASSQIEGAVTTRKKAKDMLRKNTKPRNRSDQMIVNNYLTINHIVSGKNIALTKEGLCEIHRLIVKETMEDSGDEGVYRTDNEVTVMDAIDGEVVHIPPSYDTVPELMDELIHFFNDTDNNQFIHPIIKGYIIHFMIGYIHPFVDGNGRTARALFYWYLLKKGYWLTEYLSISRLIMKSRKQYAQAYLYTETDDNDLTYFINYNLKTMDLAYQSLKEYIERKIKEKKQLFNFQKIPGINERQAIIIKWLYEEPNLLFSVKEIETRLTISNQTARTDLDGLKK